jgi:hypothetical protein
MPNFSAHDPKVKAIKPKARFGGRSPSEEIQPGKQVMRCTSAWCKPRGRETLAVWQFEVADGKHRGATLRKWQIIVDESGIASFSGTYANYCAIALGRPVTEDDDPTDVAAIFAGKTFVVHVGYRRSAKPRGGAPASDT